MNSFIIDNSQTITLNSSSYIFIKSSLIPPRSPLRKQLLSEGWNYKKSLSKSNPIRCFIIDESQYNQLYLPSPEEIEDSFYIELYNSIKLEEEQEETEEYEEEDCEEEELED